MSTHPHLRTGLQELYENIYIAADCRWHKYRGIEKPAGATAARSTPLDVIATMEQLAENAGPIPNGPAAQQALVAHLGQRKTTTSWQNWPRLGK